MLRHAQADEFERIARLIVAANADSARRCLHTHGPETADAVIADMRKNAAGRHFAVLVEEGFKAAVAADYDLAAARAWIWGPFVEDATGHEAARLAGLLAALLACLPQGIARASAFYAPANAAAIDALVALGGERRHLVHVYQITRQAWRPRPDMRVRDATAADRGALEALHALAFPNTYASAVEMFERAAGAEPARLFAIETEGRFGGYLFAHVQSDGSGLVDFLAIEPDLRARGLGRALLGVALDWLFAVCGVASAHLTVAAANADALRLYTAMGFEHGATGQVLDWYRPAAQA